jgi:ribosomal protein L7Ae-like RNA K-turn-binding protein
MASNRDPNAKLLSVLGLAMRAGKLSTGEEGVLKAIRSGRARLVVLSADASANTQKKFRDKCRFYQVELAECCTRHELGAAIGKPERVVVAVLDSGLAQLMKKCLSTLTEVKHID